MIPVGVAALDAGGQAVRVAGLVLAAGEGRRLGRPKALLRDSAGRAWVRRAVETLVEAGLDLDAVWVVVGAQAAAVRHEVPQECHVVESRDWAEGMGASLRNGLVALDHAPAVVEAAVVMLVDIPGVGSAVVRRLLPLAARDTVARATYEGRPGHPVLIGRDHWAAARAVARGDEGARAFLRTHGAVAVECGDVGSGMDVDTSADLERLS